MASRVAGTIITLHRQKSTCGTKRVSESPSEDRFDASVILQLLLWRCVLDSEYLEHLGYSFTLLRGRMHSSLEHRVTLHRGHHISAKELERMVGLCATEE